MNTSKVKHPLDQKKVVVIGGGVIGASWAALFLANGMRVVINDPQPGIESKVCDYVAQAMPALQALGYDMSAALQQLSFESDLVNAIADADFVQENGPERADFKTALWATIERSAPAHCLFFSSSSGIPASIQAGQMQSPGRLIIGHPFNPPHLLPLVEVVPNPQTARALIDASLDFYRALGKCPLEIRKEIDGFVANRLQSAIFRECVYLVSQGVITAADLDSVVTQSLGIRWATNGPFLSFHLGGGDGGFSHFVDHLAPGMETRWREQLASTVHFDEATKKLLVEQIESGYGDRSIAQLAEARDEREITIINSARKAAQ
ncbi:3-hydroxyacyl-CoA dehydrogenase NAD-binding domain-containing protein [Paraburkholderia caribensis]|uniref:3-hydroxyacyl-CoA dehydrogenase NAD-binding domain-containing protein n=1 Tax=Paraburkholderia caribensis TaxID=75105 RepID=UPI00286342B2|nr:3-hydroxyacyl-CoA dehydrogenase NAD-binding domain-containing protein [Paraburkholderia caribensis]MDR6381169.1 ketoreductase RED1 [Paraburkholderia caribensis]